MCMVLGVYVYVVFVIVYGVEFVCVYVYMVLRVVGLYAVMCLGMFCFYVLFMLICVYVF